MKIKVLGASGSEVAEHRSPAFLVDGEILLDGGTIGLGLNIREERSLRRVLLTHAHFDHIKGIPFMLDNLVSRGTGVTITVISGASVIRDLKRNIFNDRIWPDFTKLPNPDAPVLTFMAMTPSREENLNGYRVAMEKVSHTVPSYGFILRGPGGEAVAYTGDTGPTERFWKRMNGYDVRCLIVEVSFPNRLEDLALKSGHLTPGLLRKEVAKIKSPPPRICLMHVKPQYYAEIEQEIGALGLGNASFLKEGANLTI